MLTERVMSHVYHQVTTDGRSVEKAVESVRARTSERFTIARVRKVLDQVDVFISEGIHPVHAIRRALGLRWSADRRSSAFVPSGKVSNLKIN